jgi:hypothetical protein
MEQSGSGLRSISRMIKLGLAETRFTPLQVLKQGGYGALEFTG